MVLKFIGFIALCAVFLVFIGFNLENKCDISFGFARLPDVPVFFTAFVSFVLGLLASVPIAISIRIRKNRKRNGESRPAKKEGKNRAKGRGDSREDVPQGRSEPEENESPYKDDGTYGID